MRLGAALPAYGPWADADAVRQVATTAEQLGYASLWTSQRLLYALDPQNDYPPLAGQPWPDEFRRVLDPLATLGVVAGATRTIRLGTAVLNMPFYTPVVLAKQLATLDLLSGGRLDVGLGLGWSKDEYAAAGAPYEQRGARADEFIRCLRACWEMDEVTFAGQFHHVPRSIVEPKPAQRPRPPLLVGGYVRAAIRRAVRLGDGFIGGNMPLPKVAELIAHIAEECAEAGRAPGDIRVVARGSVRQFDEPQGPDRRPLWGTIDEIREDITRYHDAGLTELFLDPNFDPAINGAAVDPGRALAAVLELLAACASEQASTDTTGAPS